MVPAGSVHPRSICRFRNHCHFSFFLWGLHKAKTALRFPWFSSGIKKAIPWHEAWHYNQFAKHSGMPSPFQAAGLGGSQRSKGTALEKILAVALSNTLQRPIYCRSLSVTSLRLQTAKGSLYIKTQVTGSREVDSAELTVHGEILNRFYPWQESLFSNYFALNEDVDRNLHIVGQGKL